jgi:hypothetical protein
VRRRRPFQFAAGSCRGRSYSTAGHVPIYRRSQLPMDLLVQPDATVVRISPLRTAYCPFRGGAWVRTLPGYAVSRSATGLAWREETYQRMTGTCDRVDW